MNNLTASKLNAILLTEAQPMTSEDSPEYHQDEVELSKTAASDAELAQDDNLNNDQGDIDRTSWIWLAVGLIAGVLAYFMTNFVMPEIQAPMPPEYAEILDLSTRSGRHPDADVMELANRKVNYGRFLYSLGATMAVVFGWAAGVMHRRIRWGLAGALAGVATAVGLGLVVTPSLLDVEQTVVASRGSADLYGIVLHAIEWFVIGLPIVVAVGFGTGRSVSGLKTLGAVALAAVVGGVVYIIGGALWDPGAQLSYLQPPAGKLSYLWHCIPPFACGLFLSRSRL